jgi:hypothetical protein
MRKLTAEDCLMVLDVLRAASERTSEKCESIEEFRGAVKARSVIIDLLNDAIASEKVEA